MFLYSYFIYEISHPNKSGILQVSLVDNPEAQIDLPFIFGSITATDFVTSIVM